MSKKVLFLCSGAGGNLRFLHLAIKKGWLPGWEHISVITDRDCPAGDYAEREGLPVACVDFVEDQQEKLLNQAKAWSPDIIITTVHRILGATFLEEFDGRLINLHYSLLPAFAGSIGASPVRAAMKYGVCLGGATVHRVTGVLDGGHPQAQIAFPVTPDDLLEELMDIEFRAGCIILLAAFLTLKNDAKKNSGNSQNGMVLTIKSRNALLNPAALLPSELFEEGFWLSIK